MFHQGLMLAAALTLAACGGGSGGGSSTYTHDSSGNALSVPLQQVAGEVKPQQIYRWSDLKAGLPRTKSDVSSVTEVNIPVGTMVIVDQPLTELPHLNIEGTLVLADQDLELRAASIRVSGRLQAGTPEAPFQHKALITLTGARTNTDSTPINDGVSRGIIVAGGELKLYGATSGPQWTQLGENLPRATTTATLKESVNWQAGDTLVFAPTDFYGQASTEQVTLAASSSSNQITLSRGLETARWGQLQYVTDQGMSLTPQANFAPPQANTPTVLDERAEVANLTRRIVIQGAADTEWSANGFGAHLMVMGLNSTVQIDGVEFRRVGQAGKLARYPVHWHFLSYDPATGTELGDAQGHYIRNSAIWNSAQRCIVIHSTNGVQVTNNICNSIRGHGIFLEDATERRNTISGNLVMNLTLPPKPLKYHETRLGIGSSGLWLTNPDNTITDNHVADVYGAGLWLAYPSTTLGLSRSVNLVPRHLMPRTFARNTAHSNGSSGQLLGNAPVDDNVPNPELTQGSLTPTSYAPMLNDQLCDTDYCSYQTEFTVSGSTLYKNGIYYNSGAYRNDAKRPIYEEWVTADNVGMHFSGSVQGGILRRTLLVGQSLNTGKGYPTLSATGTVVPPSGLASYHSAVRMVDNLIVNFAYAPDQTSGAFSTEDYYLRPVEKGTSYNSGNRLISSHPGYQTLPPGMRPNPNPAQNWTLAGALWDPHGYWGPKNNYLVFNTPFFTSGVNCVPLDGATVGDGANNRRSCTAEYMGVNLIQTEADAGDAAMFHPAIQVKRYDNVTGAEIGTFRVEDGYGTYTDPNVAASYRCDPGVTPPPGNYCSHMLGHMRHFAMVPGANRYVLTFPTAKRPPRLVEFNVANGYRYGDSVVFGVQFDGRYPVYGYNIAAQMWNREAGLLSPTVVNGGKLTVNTLMFTRVSTLASIFSDTTGRRIYQDTANNMVWFKFLGGRYSSTLQASVAGTEESLYLHHSIVLAPANVCTGALNREECVARIQALP